MNPLGQEPGQHSPVSPVLPNGAINEHGILRIKQISMFAQKSSKPLSITAAEIDLLLDATLEAVDEITIGASGT